jgi:Copper transport outer membrane protein, MctB
LINFRFHIVSLVAVFLALAIGVVMGYGVLGQPTVEGLQNRIDTVEANADARRKENDELKVVQDQLNASIDAIGPFALTNRLTNVPVLVVAVRGIDDATVKRSIDLARRGGADAPGVLWLEDKWTLGSAGDLATLARTVGSTSDKKATVRDLAWRALSDRLALGRSAGTDVLRSLTDAGFVAFEGVGDAGNRSLSELGGFGTRAVLMVGTGASVASRIVAAPFARAAVESKLPLVVGEFHRDQEGEPARGSAVGPLRDDGALNKAVSTVDDLDQHPGDIVAMLAVADLGRNVVGHYGLAEGASATAPPWWQP